MESVDLNKELSELLTAHKVTFNTQNDWLVPFGKLPAIRATWFPHEDGRGVLDVEVFLDDKRTIVESFAGFGTGDDAISDALRSFSVNTLHVFLAAFWGQHDEQQVTLENWELDGKNYQVYIGNLSSRAGADINPEVPQGYFKQIEEIVRNESYDGKANWYRFFVANIDDDCTVEVLKNNEELESGVNAIAAMPWKNLNGYYSVRNFMVLKEEK